MRRKSVLRALAIVAIAACGGGGSNVPTGPTGGGTTGVTVGNNFFSPANLSVATGATVTWTWAMGDTEHTVTFDDSAPGSARQSSGTFQRTFATAGTYTYFCSVHGRAVMSGSVTVGTGGSGGGGGGGGGGGYGGGP
ncbi:MAG: cupredoxin domain-containing protein [Gemmatimonadales bacterium]